MRCCGLWDVIHDAAGKLQLFFWLLVSYRKLIGERLLTESSCQAVEVMVVCSNGS